MVRKFLEKKKAISLRKQGKTYNEILDVVPVSKSTLSLWLRDVGLAKTQRQRLTAKKYAAQKRGGAKKRAIRIAEVKELNKQGQKDITSISDRELFLLGVALYWAEGTKRAGNRPGTMVDFANSDPAMVQLFVVWLKKCCGVLQEDIVMRLHLHISHKVREKSIKKVWSDAVDLPLKNFSTTLYKKHNPRTVRAKTGSDYIGLVSIRVKQSTRLNRRIMGWIYAIIAATNQ